jgi:hypothetical protein
MDVLLGTNVGDPDPQDPHVSGPPGSGSDPLARGAEPDPAPGPAPNHSLSEIMLAKQYFHTKF